MEGAFENVNTGWLELNDKYSREWPNITESKESLPNANEHENESDKFKKYFSENIK